jgi:hypothetical protein
MEGLEKKGSRQNNKEVVLLNRNRLDEGFNSVIGG